MKVDVLLARTRIVNLSYPWVLRDFDRQERRGPQSHTRDSKQRADTSLSSGLKTRLTHQFQTAPPPALQIIVIRLAKTVAHWASFPAGSRSNLLAEPSQFRRGAVVWLLCETRSAHPQTSPSVLTRFSSCFLPSVYRLHSETASVRFTWSA